MAGRELGRPPVGELGRRRQAARMVDQRIAEADPQLRVAGIAAHGVLQDADGIFAVAVARERFGDPKPALRRREMAEEGVARLGQREDTRASARPARAHPASSGRPCRA